MQPFRACSACLLGTALTVASSLVTAGSLVASSGNCYMALDAIDDLKAVTENRAELVLHSTDEEVMSKLKVSSRRGHDKVIASSPFAAILHQMGQAEPFDIDKWPNLANYLQASKLVHGLCNRYATLLNMPLPSAHLMAQLTADASEGCAFTIEEAVDIIVGLVSRETRIFPA